MEHKLITLPSGDCVHAGAISGVTLSPSYDDLRPFALIVSRFEAVAVTKYYDRFPDAEAARDATIAAWRQAVSS